MEEREIVTCFLENEGKILILRRSKKVGTYQEKWAGVSGFVEKNVTSQFYAELEEETGLTSSDVSIIKRGEILKVKDKEKKIIWVVHPCLFNLKNPSKVKIDWEHKEIKWINPKEIDNYSTVPKLKEALKRVLDIKK